MYDVNKLSYQCATDLQWKAIIQLTHYTNAEPLFKNIVSKVYNRVKSKIVIITNTNYKREYYEHYSGISELVEYDKAGKIHYMTHADALGRNLGNVDLLLMDVEEFTPATLDVYLTKSIIHKYVICTKLYKTSLPVTSTFNTIISDIEPSIVHFSAAIKMNDADLTRYTKYSVMINSTFRLLNQILPAVKLALGNNELNTYDVLNAAVRGYYKGETPMVARDVCRTIAAIKGWKPDMDFNNPKYKSILDKFHPDRLEELFEHTLQYISYRKDLLENNIDKAQTVYHIVNSNPNIRSIVFHKRSNNAEILVTRFNSVGEGNDYKALPYYNSIKSRELINPDTGNYYTTQSGNVRKLGTKSIMALGIELMKSNKLQVLSTTNNLKPVYFTDVVNMAIVVGVDRNLLCNFTVSDKLNAILGTKDSHDFSQMKVVLWLYFDNLITDEGEPIKSKDVLELAKIQSEMGNLNIHDVTHTLTDDAALSNTIAELKPYCKNNGELFD